MRTGIVTTTCLGREENLARLFNCIRALEGVRPEATTVVFDGCGVFDSLPDPGNAEYIEIPKHGPGQEQPRNVGFRALRERHPDLTHCWFLDSDLIFYTDLLAKFEQGNALAEPRILIGPYDWLSPGITYPVPELRSDGRWASFEDHGPEHVFRHDLGASLGCFGGNLIYPVDQFERTGGFHPNLHHGRCEDGELGLRAGSMGIPMSLVREARAWHVSHPVDFVALEEKNRRDVPLLNSYHPWVQDEGFLLSEADGARFEFQCPEPGCGIQVQQHDYWEHYSMHKTGRTPQYHDPASVKGV